MDKKLLSDDKELEKYSNEVFDSVDINRNGIIEMSELKEMLVNLSEHLRAEPPSGEDLNEMYKDISNQDGVITRPEFKELLRRILETSSE